MLSASYQVTKVIDAKGDEAELSSMVRKEGATGSEAMAVNSEGEVSSMVRRHTDNEDPNQEELVDAPLQESPEDLKAALDEARARVKAAGEALKTAKEKVNATEEAKETRTASEKLREMVKDSAEKKAWEEARARLNQTEAFTEKETALQAFKKAKEERQTARRARQAINDAKKLLKAFTPNAKKASRKASKKATRKASPVAHGTVVWNPEDPAETKTEEIDTEGQTPADLSQDAEKVMNDPNIVSLPQITADPTDDNATEAPETSPATLGVSTLGGPENGGHYGSEATLG